MTHINMCGCTDTTLIMSLSRDIAILQVNWNFYRYSGDYSSAAPVIILIH